jgi:hypothetical protein
MSSNSSAYATYALTAVAAYGAYKLLKPFLTPTPLTDLRGPPSPSWIIGHYKVFRQYGDTEIIYDIIEDWFNEYGAVIRWRDLGNVGLHIPGNVIPG